MSRLVIPRNPSRFRVSYIQIHYSASLTCLKPRYITRISCLENLVCRRSSSRATGRAVCCLVLELSKSKSASSGPGESGGVAIPGAALRSLPIKCFFYTSVWLSSPSSCLSTSHRRYFIPPHYFQPFDIHQFPYPRFRFLYQE